MLRSIVLAWIALALLPTHGAAQGSDESPLLIVEDIQCRGNTATSCRFILGYLYLAKGSQVDEDEIRSASMRLATLPNFSHVNIYLERGSARGQAIVIVEVVETNPLFTEVVVGGTSRVGSIAHAAAARIGHQNVLGTGQLADLAVSALESTSGPERHGLGIIARYANPHLLGTKKNFLVGSVSYVDSRQTDSYGNFIDFDRLNLNLAVGRRLWDFSYVALSYGYDLSVEGRYRRPAKSGNDLGFDLSINESGSPHIVDLIYGWNSEDDVYFPTRGSTFNIGVSWYRSIASDVYDYGYLQFRKTWKMGEGFATLRFGTDPFIQRQLSLGVDQLLAFSYARPFKKNAAPEGIRGRWYIQPGINPAGIFNASRIEDGVFDAYGTNRWEVGLKAGVRFHSKTLGPVDLYVFGSTQWTAKD